MLTGGVLVGMQAAAQGAFGESPDAVLLDQNDRLANSVTMLTDQLHQEKGKNAMAEDVLVNTVKTGNIPTELVQQLAIEDKPTVSNAGHKKPQSPISEDSEQGIFTITEMPPTSESGRKAADEQSSSSIWNKPYTKNVIQRHAGTQTGESSFS